MVRLFQLSSVVLIAVAAYFLWSGSTDRAFVSAVLGCVSFFLGIRSQMKERNDIRLEERRKKMEAEEATED